MDRFDSQARLVFQYAKHEAQRLGHTRIAPEHLLLGALHLEHRSTDTLKQMGLGLTQARIKLEERVGTKEPLPENHIPEVSTTATTCMESAAAEARRLGSEQIGVGHVLLGIIRTAELSTRQLTGGLTVAQILGELEGGVRGVMRLVLLTTQASNSLEGNPNYLGLQLEPKKVIQLSLSLESRNHQKLLDLAKVTNETPEQLIQRWVLERIQDQ